jgi:hypothetical protein
MVAAVITTAIPYSIVSQIISAGGGSVALTGSEALGFVEGIRRGFLVSAAITVPAAVASSLRGQKTRKSNTQVEKK